jgi:hypothetical protein
MMERTQLSWVWIFSLGIQNSGYRSQNRSFAVFSGFNEKIGNEDSEVNIG